MNNTIHFIINPISGTGKQRNIERLISTHISKDKEIEIHLTRYAGHGKVIAEYLANEGAYMVVAVGGDGSMSEIGTGLAGKNTLFGIIPTGSGNGFAHHFNIPENIIADLEIINSGTFNLCDIGKFNEQYFISNVGIGYDAVVAKEFELYHSRGFLSYIKIAITQYFKFKPLNKKIIIDGTEMHIENALFISIANTSEFGNGFQIAPENNHDDAQLELVIFKKPSLFILPFTMIRFFTKSIRKSRYVSHQLIRSAVISEIECIQKDGDWIDEKIDAIEVIVLPKKLKIVSPKN